MSQTWRTFDDTKRGGNLLEYDYLSRMNRHDAEKCYWKCTLDCKAIVILGADPIGRDTTSVN